jgi:uncharacterized protein (DUF58 family)
VRNLATALSLGLTLCLLGAGFAATSLYVPGAALILSAAGALAWVHAGTRHARVLRRLGAATVQEGASLPVRVGVTHGGWLPPGAELRAWPEAEARPASRVGGVGLSTAACFPRRGRHRLGPASLRVSDPLGLCTRVVVSAPDELLVLPRIEPVRVIDTGGEPAGRRGGVGLVGETGATEVDSLRPHRPGAPASRIHWPTVARTAVLMERRLVVDGDAAPVVVVDAGDATDAGALDQAVRAAASLCVHLAQRGGCALLLPGERQAARLDSELTGFAELHAALAVVGPAAGARAVGAVSGASTILWVTAAAGGAARLRGLPVPERYLVSPHPDRRWPVDFTVSGCSGQRVDDLSAAGAV